MFLVCVLTLIPFFFFPVKGVEFNAAEDIQA